MWQTILAWLVWLSADPQAIDREAPRAAGAVAVAYAPFAPESAPAPGPAPKPDCCEDCGGKGVIVHGDGHRTSCPCPASCRCKASSASPMVLLPVRPAGAR
jgi:hypothetical protein